MLSEKDRQVLSEVAFSLGVPVGWLYNLIRFETAGTFDPTIKNPYSSARGLIQFLDSTAKGLGYLDSYNLVKMHPTFASQLRGPVSQYLTRFKPFPNKQSLYLSVFYPRYRNRPSSTPFPPSVQKANPGIDTVGDYVRKVDGNVIPGNILAIVAFIGMGTIIFKQFKRR